MERILNLVFCLILAAAVIILAFAFGHAWASSNDPFVSMLERRFSAQFQKPVYPGVTGVLVDCNCTVKYLGTRVSGRRYDVMIERLD